MGGNVESKKRINVTENPYDPYLNSRNLANKKILLIKGNMDTVIPIKFAIRLYNKLLDYCKDKEGLKLIEFKGRGHVVTSEMRGTALN